MIADVLARIPIYRGLKSKTAERKTSTIPKAETTAHNQLSATPKRALCAHRGASGCVLRIQCLLKVCPLHPSGQQVHGWMPELRSRACRKSADHDSASLLRRGGPNRNATAFPQIASRKNDKIRDASRRIVLSLYSFISRRVLHRARVLRDPPGSLRSALAQAALL